MKQPVRPRVGLGILVFIMVIALTLVVAVPLQLSLGIWGLALTELLLLASGLLPALLLKWDIKEVFPFKKPSLGQLLAVLVFLFGSYLAVVALSAITFYLFPQDLTDVSNAFLDLYHSAPLPITLFIVAVMPAVCEEVLHRGFILHNFQRVGKWPTVFALGLIFGIFHLDPFRFSTTMILGIILTYIMIETRNLWLPILFHFLNNGFSVLSSAGAQPSAEAVPFSLAAIGVSLGLVAAAPLLFLWGSRFLKSREERRLNPLGKGAKVVALGLSLALLAGGIALIAIDAGQPPVLETRISYGEVTAGASPDVLSFTVEKEGNYHLDLKVQGSNLTTTCTIARETGEVVQGFSGVAFSTDAYLYLEPGKYTFSASYRVEAPGSTLVIEVSLKLY